MREFSPTPVRHGLQFWESTTEQLVYQDTAETNTRGENEGAFTYIQRLAALAQSKLPKPGWDPEEDVVAIFGEREKDEGSA